MDSNFLGAWNEIGTESGAPRVLLIEDNPGDVALFKHYLGGDVIRQIELRTAGSLHEAEKLLATEPVDAIILDLRLPDADGVEAIKRIRSFRPDAPLIILSGNLDHSMTSNVVDAGADSFYSKDKVPIDSLLLSLKLSIDRSKSQMSTGDNGVDHDTGLFNQYGFQNVVEEAFRSACTSDSELCLLWVNVSLVGDRLCSTDAVKEVASMIEKSIRSTDYIARFNHSDFLIALPGVGQAQGERVRERIQSELERDIDSDRSISIGCACLEPSISTLTTLIVQAKTNANQPKPERS